MIDHTTYSEV